MHTILCLNLCKTAIFFSSLQNCFKYTVTLYYQSRLSVAQASSCKSLDMHTYTTPTSLTEELLLLHMFSTVLNEM